MKFNINHLSCICYRFDYEPEPNRSIPPITIEFYLSPDIAATENIVNHE